MTKGTPLTCVMPTSLEDIIFKETKITKAKSNKNQTYNFSTWAAEVRAFPKSEG